jgi:hypothetical protein
MFSLFPIGLKDFPDFRRKLKKKWHAAIRRFSKEIIPIPAAFQKFLVLIRDHSTNRKTDLRLPLLKNF